MTLSLFVVAATAFGETRCPQIAVEVRFIEAPSARTDGSRLDDSISLSSVTCLSNKAVVVAPVIVVRSGETGTITCATEHRFATAVDIRTVTSTNNGEVVQGTCIVPSDFRSRNVGTTLTVSPTFDSARRMIDIDLRAEFVTEPTWRDYTATYQRSDGVMQSVSMPQPAFSVRQVSQRVSLYSGATVLAGGLMTSDSRMTRTERRVPLLSAIPWLGRLFRYGRSKDESHTLLITVHAQVVEEHRE